MSEHGHHDPGGHELEAINTKLLFRLLVSLSIITLLASIAVVQWFNGQRRELEGRYAAEGSFQLKSYRAKMATELQGIDGLAQQIASNPAMLATPAPPSGWIHPDDLVGAGAAAPAAAPEHAEPTPPVEDEVEPVPVEPPDAEGDPEGDEAAAPKGDDAKPEPAGDDAKPPKPPKQPKPAEGDDAPKQPKQPKQPKPEPAADGE